MASNNLLKKLSSKIALILTILFVLSMSAFFFTACNDSETDTTEEPSYSYSETDDGLISNGSFEHGTINIDFTTISTLPRTSVTGWSVSGASSGVNSGVVEVTDAGWERLIDKLYADSDFLAYAESKFSFKKSEVKDSLKEELDREPTDTEIKNKIIEDYLAPNLPNPKTYSDDADDKIFMLNNYNKNSIGHGINQRVTSASTINLEKGKYGKFTVWVKTQNLADYDPSNDYGAFIALSNSFNGTSQAEYRIENIITDGITVNNGWKQYTLYVKGDEVYDTSVSLILGLGVDKHNAVEGTAYFDNVTFEYVNETATIENKNKRVLVYGDTENDVVANSDSAVYLYDMSLDKYLSDVENSTIAQVNGFKKDANATVTYGYTTSYTGVSGDRFDKDSETTATPYIHQGGNHIADTLDGYEVDLTNASYTLTYKSGSFKVSPKSYVYVEFYIKNKLSKFGATTITFDVFENYGATNPKKSPAIATIDAVSNDWVKVGLILKNNFNDGERSFYINVVIGPTDVATANTAPEYSNGTVIITNPLVASGLTAQLNDDDKENINYKLYSLFNATSNGSLSLYAGMQQDFIEDSTSEDYALMYSASDIGSILSGPAIPADYIGVISNHVYILNEYENADIETAINDRSGNGKNGSFAGLVNTKYINNTGYALSGIADALNFKPGDKDIQPLMIYNKTPDSYGYIGTENTISASAYAKISVDVRVTDGATAYIYLVDVTGKNKDIMTFDDDNLAVSETKRLVIKVTEDMLQNSDWVTVNFFIATGATAKEFRLELWNGERDASNKSSGYVFFNNVDISTAGAFTEPSNVADAFTTSGNPLYDIGLGIKDSAVQYTRVLTDLEEQFNDEQTDSTKLVTYNPSYVWAKNDSNIYAVYNTIDPVEVDPYTAESDEEDEDADSGCTAQTDPSTFWLSFSSIVLGVVLVLAILMLFIKNIRRRRKANASDAKSHFKIVSRARIYKPKADKQDLIEETTNEEYNDEEIIEEVVEDTNLEQVEFETENNEHSDEYVYGEVQDFGDDE